jgi:hypothetical protein
MGKPTGKPTKTSKRSGHRSNVRSAASLTVEPPFNMIAYNHHVKEVWDALQAQVDGLTSDQCFALLERHEPATDGHREFGKDFAKMVGDDWDGATAEIAGGAVYRAILARVGAYDPMYRPAPGILPMGEFDGCLVFYRSSEGQFEVFMGSKRERFPALFNPIHGMDLEDMRSVSEIIRKFKSTESCLKVA